MPPWHDVAAESELAPGILRPGRAADRPLCLGRSASGLFALDDVCPHAGGSLSEGMLDDDLVICPLHAYAFESASGHCQEDPGCSVRSYPVRVEAGRVQVEIEP